MNIGICDDLLEEREQLKALLLSHTPDFTILEYTNGENLLAGLARGDGLDLLFLDIYMGGINGIETAKEIRRLYRELPIIFLTTAPEFAVDSYRVQAQDYLLKPVNQEDLFQSLARQLHAIAQKEIPIPFYTVQGVMQIPLSNIIYVEAVARTLHLVQVDGTVVEGKDTIHSFADSLLKHSQFARPHRSYLLNLHHVQQMDNECFITVTGVRIPIARGNVNKMKSQYLTQMLNR